MNVLVTGGAGYIGSHTVVVLAERRHQVVVVDNFSNSSPGVMDRLERITGKRVPFAEIDIRDREGMTSVMRKHAIDAVIHFAAFKAVGESVEKPLDYFDNNISGTISLMHAMRETGCRNLVFSSSCTVYGDPDRNPIAENSPLRVASPYGRSKLVMEQLIGDVCASYPEFRAGILRYFNPVGAHPSGEMGEDPRGVPNNLLPYVCQVAVGRREKVMVFGGDYPTHDGTGVRDYIHVMDLAEAHADALDYLEREDRSFTVNLGTGTGYSVLDVIRAFEKASGREVPYEIVARRPGDVTEVYADPTLAKQLLGWSAEYGLDAMCRDAWNWQSKYPQGYSGS